LMKNVVKSTVTAISNQKKHPEKGAFLDLTNL